MSKLPIFLATVAIAGGAAIAIQQQSLSALRGEVALMRLQLDQDAKERAQAAAAAAREKLSTASTAPAEAGATASATSTGASAASATELAQLRAEVNTLKKTAQDFGRLVQVAQAKASDAAVPTKLTPTAELKNGGWTSPATAAETVIWAATSGDVDALAQGLNLTATAKAKADAWFAQLSDTSKAQYGSPEKVLALMIARDAAAVSGMQVLGQTELAPDQVGVRVRVGAEEGKVKDDTFLFRQTGGAWRLVLSDPIVERYAKQLSSKPNGGK